MHACTLGQKYATLANGNTIMNANSCMWVATWDLTYGTCVHFWRPWPWFIPRPCPWCIAPHADVIAACPRRLLLSRDVFSAEFQLSQVVCKLTVLLRAIRGLCVNPIMHLSFMSCLWYPAVTRTCYLVQSTQSLAVLSNLLCHVLLSTNFTSFT